MSTTVGKTAIILAFVFGLSGLLLDATALFASGLVLSIAGGLVFGIGKAKATTTGA